MDGRAAEVKSRDCFRTKDGENGSQSGKKVEKVPRNEEARTVEEEVLTKKGVPVFCLDFAETALQPVNREERKKV